MGDEGSRLRRSRIRKLPVAQGRLALRLIVSRGRLRAAFLFATPCMQTDRSKLAEAKAEAQHWLSNVGYLHIPSVGGTTRKGSFGSRAVRRRANRDRLIRVDSSPTRSRPQMS
jgi:hypothetical protein